MVALRKESVDRNTENAVLFLLTKVALRKESVDRNILCLGGPIIGGWSLSARRAWIEINNVETAAKASLVALRKESVDRNVKWQQGEVSYGVALRKESVDRNPNPLKFCTIC